MYDPLIDGKRLTFGVSGKLYKAALVMYDRQTESLWSQIMQEAITGPLTGAKLKMIPADHTTWEEWRSRYPQTVVLSPDTGYKHDYGLNPYEEYWELGQPPRFRRPPQRAKKVPLRAMERVVGVQLGDSRKAYPFSELRELKGELRDTLAGQSILVHFNPKAESAWVTDAQGRIVPSIMTFWFAWQDFYPNTEVFLRDDKGK